MRSRSQRYRNLRGSIAAIGRPRIFRTSIRLLTTVIATVLLAPALSFAGLTWTTTIREISALAGDKEATVDFPFANTSSTAVTINEVKTSCDCTTATPSSTKIAPNQRGSMRVVFTLGDRSGPQEKTVTIKSSDAPGTPTTLTLRVHITEVVTSHPRVLLWKLQQPAKERVIEFRAAGDHRIQSFSALPATPGFKCQLEADPKSEKFQLRVTPISADSPASAVIRLVAQVEDRPPTAVVVYAVVK